MATAARDPAIAAVLKRPFPEQVAFFRAKLGKQVPTQTWRDLWQAEHDKAFMVAGAAKADLLSDLAAAVDKALFEGGSIQSFRRDFDAIVARHGWNFKGGRNWRTRVIYTTNAATSYAAGRLAQLQQFPLWVYKHNDSVLHPRPIHLSWDGLTLPREHPFWQTHYPPNGWGCKCRAFGVSDPELARKLGGNPDKPLPGNWQRIDPKTGAPVGIDEGWAYAPGNTAVDTIQALTDGKLSRLPAPIGAGFIHSLVESEAFERWFTMPEKSWPLARLPDDDAARVGAAESVRVARLSAETAGKQRREHPELIASEYAKAQSVIDRHTAKVFDGVSIIYVREMPIDDGGGHVLVVKATRSGKALWVTSFRRLSRSEAQRDSEIRRLLRKGDEK